MVERSIRVGVRELREDLEAYLDSPVPLAITRHGQTVGYFIPARGKVDQQELSTLKQAAEQLGALLAERGIDQDEIVREFRARHARP